MPERLPPRMHIMHTVCILVLVCIFYFVCILAREYASKNNVRVVLLKKTRLRMRAESRSDWRLAAAMHCG